jgi:transposase
MRAVRLARQHGASEAARRVGADRRTVQRWVATAKKNGMKALRAKPHPGRTPRLTKEQKQRLTRELLRGAKDLGFGTDLWTAPRVGQVIRRLFGVRYHVEYLPRLLRALGWTPQKPESRAYERDEKAIAKWLKEDWPRIKRGGSEEGSRPLPGRGWVLPASSRPPDVGPAGPDSDPPTGRSPP